MQNNTIYLETSDVHAMISCGDADITLADFQAQGNEPGSQERYGYPATDDILQWGRAAIGKKWNVRRVQEPNNLLI